MVDGDFVLDAVFIIVDNIFLRTNDAERAQYLRLKFAVLLHRECFCV